MTVDQELFADTLPTYLSRFVGREQELQDLVIWRVFVSSPSAALAASARPGWRLSWRRYSVRTALLTRDTPTPSGYRSSA
jgi:hypothetical protein